jgi:hypothetical protein
LLTPPEIGSYRPGWGLCDSLRQLRLCDLPRQDARIARQSRSLWNATCRRELDHAFDPRARLAEVPLATRPLEALREALGDGAWERLEAAARDVRRPLEGRTLGS